MAWSSPTLPKLLDPSLKDNPFDRIITEDEASWMASIIAIGGALGTYAAGWSAERIGRKKALVIFSVMPFIASFMLICSSTTILLFYVARFLAGIGVSGVYTIIPLYNGEIAEDCNQGQICCSMMTFQTAGQFLTYCVGPYFKISCFTVISGCITITGGTLVITVIPESLYYLISINNKSEAEKALIKLRSTVGREISNELTLIQMVVEDYIENQGSVMDVFSTKALRKAQIMSIALITFQTCSGIAPILFYSESIFKEAGSAILPHISAMVIGFIQFASSFVAPNLVDKFGRRWMLFISASGMCISEVCLGLYFAYKHIDIVREKFYWVLITLLVLYMITYVMGLGPLVWTVMAEVFPNDVKAAAASVVVGVSWVLTFVVSKLFNYFAFIIGMLGIFWMFAGNCAIAAIFSLTYLIETKGKNFQEIQQLLRK